MLKHLKGWENTMKPKIDYTLYLVTDRDLMTADSIEECVRQAISGGCTVIQLREKTASSYEFYDTALRLRAITASLGVPLIINDRADIALAVDADGVHVGQKDLPYEVVRRIVGPDKIVGVSTHTLKQAKLAEKMGADYIGVGAMFATGTKSDATPAGVDVLRNIRKEVNIPMVAIGGISKNNVSLLTDTGVDGIAVVSAVVAEHDIAGAARELKALLIKGENL
jgi:thiamine-phosphate pyrophosphorylase